ncbi:MAG: choice-of-anchor Q domain-containing protein [Planctomycetota bacterium]
MPEDVTTDLKGSDRIINDTVDMGAYEYDSGC